MLKYSEVNRTNETQQELLFKWRQDLFLSNIKSRKFFGKGYGGEDKAGETEREERKKGGEEGGKKGEKDGGRWFL